jgi:ankyrin repeat protein
MASASDVEMIRSLLEHSPNVDVRCDWDDTPLTGTARGRPIDEMVIELLLQAGADVNAVMSRRDLFSAPNALIFAC